MQNDVYKYVKSDGEIIRFVKTSKDEGVESALIDIAIKKKVRGRVKLFKAGSNLQKHDAYRYIIEGVSREGSKQVKSLIYSEPRSGAPEVVGDPDDEYKPSGGEKTGGSGKPSGGGKEGGKKSAGGQTGWA